MFVIILSISAVITGMDTENVYALETFTSKDGMYTYIRINDKKIQLQSYEGTDRDLVIPSKVDGYTVARLRCNTFIDFDSITLPDSMEDIPSQTLMGCEAKKIVLGKNTTEIKNEAFWNCSNLTEIVLPDTLKRIDGKAFMNCSSLTAIRIPKSVSSVGEIGGSPFPGCGSLQSIDVDENGMVSAKSAGHAVITAYIDRANISTKTVICSSNAKPPAGEDTDKDNNNIVSISKMKAKLSQSTFTYNGTNRRPKVIISGLTESVDYKCSGSRKSIGTGTVTVTGTGKYSGTKKLFFKVVPQTPKFKSLKSGKKSFKAVFSKVSGNTRYQIAYKQSGGKWKKKTVSYKTSGITVKKLKSRKTYYVKIRAFKTVDGKNYYGAYTKARKVKVR